MSTTIQAIETRYRGYRFRSRLEARWAVFFDRLGCTWEYEPEGFTDSAGLTYLPDFWLPAIRSNGVWLEIKGTEAAAQDHRAEKKLGLACRARRCDGYIAAGDPYQNVIDFGSGDNDGLAVFCTREDGGFGWCDAGHLFCLCPVCARVGIAYAGRGERVCGDTHGKPHDDKCFTYDAPILREAAALARFARFEHGEHP